jgi:hypothetical protein
MAIFQSSSCRHDQTAQFSQCFAMILSVNTDTKMFATPKTVFACLVDRVGYRARIVVFTILSS